MSKCKPPLDRSTTETRGSEPAKIDISHGEPIWITPSNAYSTGPVNLPSITLDSTAYHRRIARWKAEAKRLRKILVKIANANPTWARDMAQAIAMDALRSPSRKL